MSTRIREYDNTPPLTRATTIMSGVMGCRMAKTVGFIVNFSQERLLSAKRMRREVVSVEADEAILYRNGRRNNPARDERKSKLMRTDSDASQFCNE